MRDVLKLRLKEIEDQAGLTFGEGFHKKWISTPSRFFENKSPLEFASNEKRAEKVLEYIRNFQGATI